MKLVLLILLHFFILETAFSQSNPITLKDGTEFYKLGLHLDILEDKTKKLKISDVNSPKYLNQFQKSKVQIPNYGYSKSAYWFRLKIKNASKKIEWFLSFNVFYQNHIEFYRKKSDGGWDSGVLGDKYTFNKRFQKIRPFVFPLAIEKEAEVFIRVVSDDGAGEVNLTLLTPAKMAEKESATNLFWGLYFGLFLSMVIYNAFIFLSTKSIAFFYYVIYCLGGGFYMAFYQGYVAAYLFKETPWVLAIGNAWSMAIIGISLNLFVFSYLDLKRDKSKTSLYYYFLIFMHTLALLLSGEGTRYYSMIISNLFIPITFISSIVVAHRRKKEGYRPAKYYIIAFFVLIFGATIWCLMTAGLFPTNDFNNHAPIIAQAFQMLLLSMGLADRFNYEKEVAALKEQELQTQIISQEKQMTETLEMSLQVERKLTKDLNELNANLDQKVKERTSELNEALKSISSLLDNMRQSVFTVGREKVIMKPVSGFSQVIFGEDITGKTVFETIYSSLDEESELYSKISFSFNIMFGFDELQWLLFKDIFPTTLKYFPQNNKKNEKILKINYSPLYDESGLLIKIMFVVEDVTDLLKLEHEMAKQKEEELKNLETLQELASNKKEDLALFFKDAIESEQNILNILKTLRVRLENGDLKGDLSELFRILHTLKGNARIFNLSKISKKIHSLENFIEELVKVEGGNIHFKVDKINEFIQGTYDLQGITNRYLKAAKDVFSIDFGEGLKLKEGLHDLIKVLEIDLKILENSGPLISDLDPEKDNFFSLKTFFGKPQFEEFIKNWKITTHSLKGNSRAMDEEDLSQKVHALEASLFNIEGSLTKENPDLDKIESSFFKSYKDVKETGGQIYIQSLLFDPKHFEIIDSLDLLFSIFEFTKTLLYDFKNEKKKEEVLNNLNHLIDQMISLSKDQQMDYIQSLSFIIKDSLNKGGKEDLILHDLCKIWQFFYILMAIDSNQMPEDTRQNFALLINQGPEQRKDLIKLSENTLISKLLHKISNSSKTKDVNEFFDIMDALQVKVLKDFSPKLLIYEDDLKEDINFNFFQLKQKGPFPQEVGLDAEIKPLFKLIKILCEHNMPCSYHAKIDLIKFLRPYTGIDDHREFSQKPLIKEVLVDNLNACKKALFDYFDEPPKGFSLTLDKCFEKLREEPIKYTLSKFKNVVDDVSKTLGKITTFNITGDQSSMSHEKLGILQEALLHLIRNALDHGLETPEERKKRGKSERGLIQIDIIQKDKETKILLKDDGKGINIEQVSKKAINQGLISENELKNLTDKQKIDLIFSPNLSTKEQVSEISGRGVGMDIVKKNIERMGGKINIKTSFGQSTEFEIIIPD